MFVFGDWHGDDVWASTVLSNISKGALVVHVGDFGIWPGPVGKRFLMIVERLLAEKSAHMLLVPGNHEDYNRIGGLKPVTSQVHPDVSGLTNFSRLTSSISVAGRPGFGVVEGQTCAFLGGAVSVDRHRRRLGTSYWADECFTLEDALALQPAEVLFTHEVPAGVDMSQFAGPEWMFDRSALKEAAVSRGWLRQGVDVVKPSWLFHGHWHVGYTVLLSGFDYTTTVVGLADQQSYGNAVEFVNGQVSLMTSSKPIHAPSSTPTLL